MVAEIDYDKCTLCGTYKVPVCVERCPTGSATLREKDGKPKVEVTEFLCEDCNECGFRCPDKAITIKEITW